MFALFKRTFVLIVGFLLVFALIWVAGPYFAFGSYRPLESPMSRLIVFGAVVGVGLIKRLIRRLRAFRASDRLLAAVVAQPQPEPDRAPSEVIKLRERFEEAVSALKKGRRGGHNLYDLPWYVIIGSPGSGKTTALLNSGLKFPLEQRVGKGALRGVGGTRNCDWWFTDEAVFLDTAGRYTTQDSDAASDSLGWREFLGLLRKHRARRPLNGVILTVDAQVLVADDAVTREMHVEAARRRLEELARELRIQLPVYVIVTKCDLVDGFSEFFEDLTAHDRAQVWGVTFAYEQTVANEGPRLLPAEFDALMTRLNERVFDRVENGGDPRRRSKVFAFPQQMGAMRAALTSWIAEVFDTRTVDGQVLLRGVYFTSGTQEGTPIDRLLGSIGRQFRASEAVLRPSGPGKAYFVENLLKQVMIAESGLAGVNRRLEFRNASMQLGAYISTAIMAVLAVVGLSLSYQSNREFLEEIEAQIGKFEETATVTPASPLPAIVDRLNALRAVVDSSDRYRSATPWLASWGLYQGSSIGNPAHAAYAGEFDNLLLARLRSQIEARLSQYANDSERLPTYLKAYLMLGRPGGAPDEELIQSVAEREWQQAVAGSAIAAALSTHFKVRLQEDAPLRKQGVDATLVAQAQSNLRQMPRGKILYQTLKLGRLGGDEGGLRLDQLAGVGAEKVFRRRSGQPLSAPIPRLYTPDAFNEIKNDVSTHVYAQIAKDGWVWGETTTSAVTGASSVVAAVMQEYETDYIRAWNELLADIDIVPFSTLDDIRWGLRLLSDRTASPLRRLLSVVRDNTTLSKKSAAAAPPKGWLEAGKKKGNDIVGGVLSRAQSAASIRTDDWGRQVTSAFQWVHQLLGNNDTKTQLDAFLESLQQVQAYLDRIGPDLGGQTPARVLSDPEFRRLMQTVERQAEELYGLDHVVDGLAATTRGEVQKEASNELESIYGSHVVATCARYIDNKYPFSNMPSEMSLADFAMVFGYEGLFDRFFAEHLVNQVDSSGPNWTSRPGALELPARLLRQFQDARAIRDMFFPVGSKSPRVEFSVKFSNLTRSAARFFLDIHGTSTDFTHQGSPAWLVVWPASRAGVWFQFVDAATNYPNRKQEFAGSWAWLRLADAMRGPSAAGQVGPIQIRTDQHSVDVQLESSGAAGDPFSNTAWRQFRCGA